MHTVSGDGSANRIQTKLLRVLIVEDSADDAEMVELALTHAGYDVAMRRVMGATEFANAIAAGDWDVVVADYTLPSFGAIAALDLLKQSGRDIPFIIVSGTISEETAVTAMRTGAHDYVLKDNLTRLVPAIEREMQEAVVRRQKLEAEGTLRLQGAALDAAANAIVITDREGAIQWVNPAFTKLTGYSAEEAIGQNPRVLKSDKHDAEDVG